MLLRSIGSTVIYIGDVFVGEDEQSSTCYQNQLDRPRTLSSKFQLVLGVQRERILTGRSVSKASTRLRAMAA